MDEKQVVSIISTFDIASEITGQRLTETFVLYRQDLYEHHHKLLIPVFSYPVLLGDVQSETLIYLQ